MYTFDCNVSEKKTWKSVLNHIMDSKIFRFKFIAQTQDKNSIFVCIYWKRSLRFNSLFWLHSLIWLLSHFTDSEILYFFLLFYLEIKCALKDQIQHQLVPVYQEQMFLLKSKNTSFNLTHQSKDFSPDHINTAV